MGRQGAGGGACGDGDRRRAARVRGRLALGGLGRGRSSGAARHGRTPTHVQRPLPSSCRLASLRSAAQAALATARTPSTRQEAFRFTDPARIVGADLVFPVPTASPVAVDPALLAAHALPGAAAVMVVVDGVLRPELGSLSGLPAGVFAGPLDAAAPPPALAALGVAQAASPDAGCVFVALNSAAATGVAALAVPAGVDVGAPVHVLYISTNAHAGRGVAASAPRLLISLGDGAAAQVVEEFVSAAGGGAGLTVALAEAVLGAGSRLDHGYVALEGGDAWHVKRTAVTQAAESSYALVEARLGGGLTRGDVDVVQAGPSTTTSMRSFLLAGPDQTHDLHSRLELDFPEGTADQLHK